ncbi:cutinase G-box binding protein [Rutstroemia sp. NJR-2017a BBW]|nr:cutinase G-box binding protein [Rutstroemia sp. NJR-2017a BBW]
MIVYGEQNDSFPTGISQLNISLTSSASDSFSDSPNSSWDNSQHLIGTPASSVARRMSIDDTHKLEDLSFHMSTPSSSGLSSRYGGNTENNAFCAMSAMTQDMLTGFQDSNMFFGMDEAKSVVDTSNLNYNSFQTFTPGTLGSFESQCPPSDIPSLMDDLYSPTSTVETLGAMDFVDPSQTTFMDTFPDYQSSPQGPITPNKFGTPGSDFSPQRSFHDYSPVNMGGYLVPSTLDFTKFESPSPARQAALRQPLRKSPQSRAALQRIQQANLIKPARGGAQIKQEVMDLPPSFTVENRSTHECLHDGCGQRFKRQEHLVRHKRDVHDPDHKKHKCPHCPKTIGRSDNLREHVKRHTSTGKAKRTPYVPGADATYASMGKRSRKTDVKPKPKSLSIKTRVQKCQV